MIDEEDEEDEEDEDDNHLESHLVNELVERLEMI